MKLRDILVDLARMFLVALVLVLLQQAYLFLLTLSVSHPV
jgi:hypothetical protein